MKVKVMLAVFIVLGMSFTLYQILKNDHSSMITQKEAEDIAVELYGGKVLNSTVKNGSYEISLHNDKGTYTLNVDGMTKRVSDVKLIERNEALLSIEEAKKNIEKELNGSVIQIKETDKNGEAFAEATVEKDHKLYDVQYDLKKKNVVASIEIKEAQQETQTSKDVEKNNTKETPLISEQQAKNIALQQIEGNFTNLSEVTTQNGKHYKVTVDGQTDGAHVYVQANTGEVSSIYWYSKEQSVSNVEDDDEDDEDDDD